MTFGQSGCESVSNWASKENYTISYILNPETVKTELNSLAWESSKKTLIDERFCVKCDIHFS